MCECVSACVCLVVVNTCYYLAIPTSTLSSLAIAHWFSSVGRESTVLSLEKWLTARRASIWLQPCLSEHHIQEPDRVRAKKTLGDNWEDNLDFLFYGTWSRKDGRLELWQLSHHHRKLAWMLRKQSLDMEREVLGSASLLGPLNNTAPQVSCNPCILQFTFWLKPVPIGVKAWYYYGTSKNYNCISSQIDFHAFYPKWYCTDW